ncbi:hypothetical protein KW791_02610 [Candidatus Parcubacteria bacterium]|nr:hypothetical protein [Candidatus Parcubacteria bacterium]
MNHFKEVLVEEGQGVKLVVRGKQDTGVEVSAREGRLTFKGGSQIIERIEGDGPFQLISSPTSSAQRTTSRV